MQACMNKEPSEPVHHNEFDLIYFKGALAKIFVKKILRLKLKIYSDLSLNIYIILKH